MSKAWKDCPICKGSGRMVNIGRKSEWDEASLHLPCSVCRDHFEEVDREVSVRYERDRELVRNYPRSSARSEHIVMDMVEVFDKEFMRGYNSCLRRLKENNGPS